VSLHRLEHTKSRLFHIGNSLILLLHEPLVVGLELLDLSLEVLLGIGERLLAVGDLGVKISIREGHCLLDLRLLLGVTQVKVGWATAGPEVLLSESLEVVESAAALIVLHVVRVTVLDSWVTLNAELAAQVLVNSAVNIGNEGSLGVLEFFHELVPGRLHGFAVASPRGEELDEHGLTRGQLVEVVWGQLGGGGECNECKEKSGTHPQKEEKSDYRCVDD